jgi:predicted nucleotidyltransferase
MQTEKLLKLLKENKVKFVIIGATAFPVHGYSRATLDIDILPKNTNTQKTLKALKEFGYDVTDITIDDLLTRKVLIRQYLLETDMHPAVKGVTFKKVWKNKVKARFGKTFVWFASLDDLITMKKAASRTKDVQDLKYLRRLKNRAKKR